jgi:CRP/FNR family cyclic AMP-dependent transcriptional regulator
MEFKLNPDPQNLPRLEALLAKIRHFEGLPRPTLERLAALAWPRHFEAGQVIYIEGEPAERIYLLERGWVKATRISREGREQALMFLRSDEIFGDIAIYSGSNYPGTVSALEDVDVWVLPAEAFLKLVAQDAALAMAVIQHLSDRVLHYIELVKDLSLRSVEARLANTLLQHATVEAGQLVVPRRHWTTFDEMAVRLGTVRDVLSRALKTLEADGLLRVEKQAIILLDVEALAQRGDL